MRRTWRRRSRMTTVPWKLIVQPELQGKQKPQGYHQNNAQLRLKKAIGLPSSKSLGICHKLQCPTQG